MLSIIVAIAQNNVIGRDNQLIWHIPDDLKRFKQITTGHTIIMGRKTFESIGRVLPNRKHIVLSKNTKLNIESENVKVLDNVNMLDKYISSEEEAFVIGGDSIYKLLMPYVTKMYITRIKQDFQGDAYFPEINSKEWKIISRKPGIKNEENPYDYEYIDYERILV